MVCRCSGTLAAFLFRGHAYRGKLEACFCWLLFALAVSFENIVFLIGLAPFVAVSLRSYCCRKDFMGGYSC